MSDELKLKMSSLLRRMGLAKVPKQVLICAVVAALALMGLGLWRFWPAGDSSTSDDFEVVQNEVPEQDKSVASQPSVIAVDVEGEVASPGLYELEGGARVGDAVEKAGGLTKRASRGEINLAEKLADGQLVYVPRKDASGSVASEASAVSVGSAGTEQGKININTASAQELQTLSGIGESISQRIVDYRETNGKFESVDDLTKVSGIGDSRLASIRDRICV